MFKITPAITLQFAQVSFLPTHQIVFYFTILGYTVFQCVWSILKISLIEHDVKIEWDTEPKKLIIQLKMPGREA